MTAPTVLPSELQDALNYLCEHGTFSERKSARTIRAALLTMQRERDQWKSRANIAAGIIETATEQLAASERTCAELREELTHHKNSLTKKNQEIERLRKENIDLRIEYRAAERTVEELKAK